MRWQFTVMQAKYECARSHSKIKVISPDWVVDSVEANSRLEEKWYHPSLLRSANDVSMESCNGAMPAEEVPVSIIAPAQSKRTETTPTSGKGVALRSRPAPVGEVSIPITALSSLHHVQSSQVAMPTSKGGKQQATPRNIWQEATPTIKRSVRGECSTSTGKREQHIGKEEHPVTTEDQATPTMREEATLTVRREEEVTPTVGEKATPTVREKTTPTVRKAAEAVWREEKATPTNSSSEEQGAMLRCEKLLDGAVIYFTDYHDCVEADTLDKWKLVSIMVSIQVHCYVSSVVFRL
jgi:hypothetical protein